MIKRVKAKKDQNSLSIPLVSEVTVSGCFMKVFSKFHIIHEKRPVPVPVSSLKVDLKVFSCEF